MNTNLKEDAVINGFLGVVDKHLAVTDKAILKRRLREYRQFTSGKIETVDFQNAALKSACAKPSGIWTGELATGSGKSVIAAKIALNFLKHGRVLYICPNPTAFGDESAGIIQNFHRVFHQLDGVYKLGRLNDPSRLNDVIFMTPGRLNSLRKSSPKLVEKLLRDSHLLIVDEAQHFPSDPKAELVIYGQIERMAKENFLSRQKKVVTLTATHFRLDGKPVMNTSPLSVDFRFCVQDSVDAARCPEIWGMQVFLPVDSPSIRKVGEYIDLGLKGREYRLYWRMVAGAMVKVWKRFPGKPTCAFVRMKSEAQYLAKIFNHSSGLGDRGLAVLTSDTTIAARGKVLEEIKSKRRLGYITCGVGEEAINVPPLQIVHLIRRTKSLGRNMQAIGRALRVHSEKPFAFIVDYQVAKANVISSCSGLIDFVNEVAKSSKRRKKVTLVNGGPLIIRGSHQAVLKGIEMEKETEWMTRTAKRDASVYKAAILEMARQNMAMPSKKSSKDFRTKDGTLIPVARLAINLRTYVLESSRLFDPVFRKELESVRKDWNLNPNEKFAKMRDQLIQMAKRGDPRPPNSTPIGKYLSRVLNGGSK